MLVEVLRNLAAVIELEYLMTQGAGKTWLVRFAMLRYATLPLLLVEFDNPAFGVDELPFFLYE